MLYSKHVAPVVKRAWTVRDWGEETSLSRATIYRLMANGAVRYVNVGKARRILTPPEQFLDRLEAGAAAE